MFVEITIADVVEKVIVSLTAKTATDGVATIVKKIKNTPEKKVENALRKALDKVSRGNEFWKNDVKRQKDDVISILLQIMYDDRYLDKCSLPSYLDKKTINCLEQCLKKDKEAWNYVQKQLYDYILREITANSQETLDIVKEIAKHFGILPFSMNNHFLTPLPMKADANNIIGRDKDLQALWKVLNNNKAVLLTGFGGIGKTKLAQMLFHVYEERFDEVAWIKYKGDLIKSFLANINVPKFREKNYRDEKERWNAIESTLTNDGKTKLFIIDNVDCETKQNPLQDGKLQELINWKNTTILLTSRLKQLEDYYVFPLEPLNIEDCVKMFNHYYQGEVPDPQKVVEIVELANRHTMTIELLAKGAWQEDFDDYFEKVKTGFDKIDGLTTTKHHIGEDTIARHLQLLFNMQKRTKIDKKILYSFAILPVNCECTKKELEEWFGFKKTDWSAVIQDGWLIYDGKSRTYFLHPLVRSIVRLDFKGRMAPKGIANKLLKYMEISDGLFRIDKGFASLQRMIGIMESVMCAVIQEETEQFATLYNHLGFCYHETGNYAMSLENYDKALKIRKKVLGANHPDTAQSYNNIGVVYRKQGNYDAAIENYDKALKIRKKVLGTEHLDTAQSYNNIGVVNVEQGNYDVAIENYDKALKIRKKVLGTEHLDTAQSYNNMGEVYRKQGNYDMALTFYNKALEIKEKALKTERSDTPTSYNEIASTSYNGIGAVYMETNNYDEALKYYSLATKIREEVFGMNHPYTAQTYNNIGMLYKKQGNYNEARVYFEKTYRIYKTIFGPNHSFTTNTLTEINAIVDKMHVCHNNNSKIIKKKGGFHEIKRFRI